MDASVNTCSNIHFEVVGSWCPAYCSATGVDLETFMTSASHLIIFNPNCNRHSRIRSRPTDLRLLQQVAKVLHVLGLSLTFACRLGLCAGKIILNETVHISYKGNIVASHEACSNCVTVWRATNARFVEQSPLTSSWFCTNKSKYSGRLWHCWWTSGDKCHALFSAHLVL